MKPHTPKPMERNSKTPFESVADENSEGARGSADQAFKSKRNSTVPKIPIHGLPDEVLVQVFLWIRDEWNESYATFDPKLLQNLASVCRLWHSIVLSSPQLWSRVSSAYTPPTVQLFLRKSGAAPLTVKIDLPLSAASNDFYYLISPSSSRWHTVIWRAPLTPRAIDFLRYLPCSVAVLDISSKVVSQSPQTIELLGDAPFKFVRAHAFQLDWHSARLAQLSHLQLERAEFSWEHARTMISASPGLKTLCFRNISPPPNDNAQQSDHSTIELFMLSTLIIEDAHPLGTLTASLAQTLSLPNVRILFMKRLPSSLLSETDCLLLPAITRLIRAAPRIDLVLRTGAPVPHEFAINTGLSQFVKDWYPECQPDQSACYIEFYSNDAMDLLSRGAAFVAATESPSPIILDLRNVNHPDSRRDRFVVPSSVLFDLSKIIQITIRSDFDEQALVEILAADDRLCPMLNTLDVAGPVHMVELVARRGGRVAFGRGLWTK